MKKNFLSGLIVLLPFVLTTAVVVFFVNLLTKPFIGIVEATFKYFELLDKTFFYLSGQQIINLTSKILILIFLTALTLLIGFLASLVFWEDLLKALDRIIHRIPVANKMYKAFQEVIDTVFKAKSSSFSKVVLIPYPHDDSYAIGFITKDALPENTDKNYTELITVFVPATPNPTIGFSMLYKKEQVIFLEMKVEEALKFLISFGMQLTEFKKLPR